eukprot:COSAG04_NODE_717_length_10852_cov_7.337580_3_plen_203_part_00
MGGAPHRATATMVHKHRPSEMGRRGQDKVRSAKSGRWFRGRERALTESSTRPSLPPSLICGGGTGGGPSSSSSSSSATSAASSSGRPSCGAGFGALTQTIWLRKPSSARTTAMYPSGGCGASSSSCFCSFFSAPSRISNSNCQPSSSGTSYSSSSSAAGSGVALGPSKAVSGVYRRSSSASLKHARASEFSVGQRTRRAAGI